MFDTGRNLARLLMLCCPELGRLSVDMETRWLRWHWLSATHWSCSYLETGHCTL